MTLQRAFVDFLASVDLPKIRDEEFCVKAATAFHKNEVMYFTCLAAFSYMQRMISDVRLGRHYGCQYRQVQKCPKRRLRFFHEEGGR